jgi:hypothetical protein
MPAGQTGIGPTTPMGANRLPIRSRRLSLPSCATTSCEPSAFCARRKPNSTITSPINWRVLGTSPSASHPRSSTNGGTSEKNIAPALRDPCPAGPMAVVGLRWCGALQQAQALPMTQMMASSGSSEGAGTPYWGGDRPRAHAEPSQEIADISESRKADPRLEASSRHRDASVAAGVSSSAIVELSYGPL